VLALKHVGAINIEQYNKLSIKCAFVHYTYSKKMDGTKVKITAVSQFEKLVVAQLFRK
jgi:hypothetical protein